ncbi:hypothetical protein BC629DRAFT_1601560 [Irpex lacteus]|nr:hypothetical protein BC629DRAFT_1601560 [Irpex lacteus]
MSRCLATELPDEILDDIIRLAGPRYHTLPHISTMYRSDLRQWLPCTKVCRRWYRIGIPYLFRFVKIDDSSPGDLEDFCNVLQDNAYIAHVMQGISIVVEDLYLDTLASLLRYLPQLRYLIIAADAIHPGDKLDGCYALEQLVYETCRAISEKGPNTWDVIQLLQMFDDVDELVLGPTLRLCYQSRSDSDQLQSAVTKAGKPQIRSLKLACFEYTIAPYLTSLYDTHALDNITCLSIWYTRIVETYNLNQMLLYVGATLGELYLYIDFDPLEDVSRSGREVVANTLQSGFAACAVLHGVRVEMNSTAEIYTHWTRERIGKYVKDDWLFALNIFALVAGTHSGKERGQIRHLAFSYHPRRPCRDENYGCEFLPWERMRVVFGKFIDLKSLTVVSAYVPELEYAATRARWVDERLTLLPTAEEYTRKELEVFKDILHCSNRAGHFFACSEKSCQWNIPRSRDGDIAAYLKFR